MKMKRRVDESEGLSEIEPGPMSSVGYFPCNKSKHISPSTPLEIETEYSRRSAYAVPSSR